MARSSWTPREPLTRTTSPGCRFLASHSPAVGGIGQKDRGDSAQAGCGSEMLCIAAHAHHEIDSGIGGRLAGCRVQHRGMLAEFEHFSSDEDAALGRARGQRLNHGSQCFRVGVVAVVENRGAANFQHFSALAAGRERFERGDCCIERNSRFERNGEAGHGVLRVVLAEKTEVEVAVVFARHESVRAGPRYLPSHREWRDRRKDRCRSRRPCRENRGRTAKHKGRSS